MAASRKEVPRYETRELAALSVSSAKHEASDVPSNATPSVPPASPSSVRDERSVGERAPGERPQRRTSESASVELSAASNGASVERK